MDGKTLRLLRMQAGLLQYELAAMLGIKQSTLSDYERGRGNIPEARQAQIHDTLNFSTKELEAIKILINERGVI